MALPFTFRQLEYFDAIASEGTLSAAAERCRVSASALALGLDDLEAHLGVQLFVRRKGRGVTVTPTGSRLLLHARLLLSGGETLATDAWQTAATLSGPYRVGCFTTLTPFFLPGIMEVFQREHPALELEYVEAPAPELHELLLNGRVNAALMYSVDVSRQLTFDAVHEFTPHVLLAARHPLASRRKVRLRELIGEPQIVLDVQPARQNTAQIFASLDLEPSVGHVTSNYELVRCLVGRGLGYAVMFQRPMSTRTYDGNEVTMIDLDDDVPSTVVGLARPAGASRSTRHDELLAFLRAGRDLQRVA